MGRGKVVSFGPRRCTFDSWWRIISKLAEDMRFCVSLSFFNILPYTVYDEKFILAVEVKAG